MSAYTPFLVILSICLVLTGLAFTTYGLPANVGTYAWFGIALLFCLPLIRNRRWKLFLPFPFVYFLPIFVPWESHYIMDVRGGRLGIELYPSVFRFGGPGINTDLVQDYLGPVKPEWHHCNIRSLSFGLGDWRDGDDRYHRRSMLFREYLPDALCKLPDDNARKRVLECITDPTNILKFYQEMLLVCLKDLDYPPGYNAESWWRHHERFFYPVTDPKQAAIVAAGWSEKVHLYWQKSEEADRYSAQVQRYPCYDEPFRVVESFLDARRKGKPIDEANLGQYLWGKAELPVLGVDVVAWWPVPPYDPNVR